MTQVVQSGEARKRLVLSGRKTFNAVSGYTTETIPHNFGRPLLMQYIYSNDGVTWLRDNYPGFDGNAAKGYFVWVMSDNDNVVFTVDGGTTVTLYIIYWGFVSEVI